jgi:hypothetical protein
MNTRIVRLTRFSAPACATMITAFTAWAFLSSTACGERDPGPQGDRPPAEVRVYAPPDLLAVPPPCLGRCA